MHKKAFTLVEILLVLFTMGVIVILLIAVFRPIAARRNVYFAIATLKTINEINQNLIAQNDGNGLLFEGDGIKTAKRTKVYCNKFFDEASTKGANNCNSTTLNATNIELSNGVALKNISQGWQEYETPAYSGRIGRVVNITADIDGNSATTDDTYTFRIYRHSGIAVPTDTYMTGTDPNKTFKYYVASKTKGALKSTLKGISFAEASCITGLYRELYSYKPITTCNTDTTFCPTYFDCEILPAKLPHLTRIFGLGF